MNSVLSKIMQALYMDDSYLKEFSAIVTGIDRNNIMLDKTAFYPTGGGQPNDIGKIIKDGQEFDVVKVTKNEGQILHQLNSADSLNVGDNVTGIIDWERRYKLMRMHTAAHVIDAILYKEANALATGGQLGTDKSRMDFSLEVMDKEMIARSIDAANEIIRKDIEVKTYYLDREEALKIPGIIKLANVMPPNIERLRIVEIPGVDIQADGGTQVKNTSEIGEIVLLSVENRGKSNRRIYYTVK